ncbi:MAG: Phosphate transport system permease protein PstA [Candidatus Omnitrophica bacterium ADurb.Bin292]|nr:MAG: Phosphate transport system permease protein PstA [Candidatus Omnitrophica bacterium ADurb.Bin292]
MMTLATAKPLFDKKGRSRGESFVWLTSTGLAIGLAMIVYILSVIFTNGIKIFWPPAVAIFELEGEPSDGFSGRIAGVIAKRQFKMVHDPEDHKIEEWQIFLGNREVYGTSYKFFDKSSIREIRYPRDVLRLERREYGDALVFPVSLKIAGKEKISFGDPGFEEVLSRLVRETNERWKEIQRIEKKEIGLINHKIEKLRLREKSLRERGLFAGDQKRVLEESLGRLKGDYQVLADRAGYLRQTQDGARLGYRLPTGQEMEISTGKIVDFYFPNRLGMVEKCQFFLKRLWRFLTEEPREANTEGGVFPAIFGTFVMTVLMSLAVTPFGVLAAIYLREYAREGFLLRAVRVAINNLAGVPSIVFGVFGMGFFVYFVGGTVDRLFFRDALPTPTFGTGGILWASLTLALLTIPVVIVAAEEAIASVPRGMREGSFACGASKWQTIQRIVLPAAAPGILTGVILAMARGASEVAPLMIVGVVKLAPNLPIDGIFPWIHLERKFMHLGFHIYDLGFQSPDSDAAKPMVFATALLLITLVVVMNLGAILIREHLRKKYATGAF